jgi:hypothetical protein
VTDSLYSPWQFAAIGGHTTVNHHSEMTNEIQLGKAVFSGTRRVDVESDGMTTFEESRDTEKRTDYPIHTPILLTAEHVALGKVMADALEHFAT